MIEAEAVTGGGGGMDNMSFISISCNNTCAIVMMVLIMPTVVSFEIIECCAILIA